MDMSIAVSSLLGKKKKKDVKDPDMQGIPVDADKLPVVTCARGCCADSCGHKDGLDAGILGNTVECSEVCV